SRGGSKKRSLAATQALHRSAAQSLRFAEDFLLPQQVVHRAGEPGPENDQRLRLAAFRLVAFHPRLGASARTNPQAYRLADRPAQMRVADLLRPLGGTLRLAGRFMLGPHQPAVRQKVADLGKTSDVM